MTQSEVEKIKFYDVFVTLCLLGYKCTFHKIRNA